MPEQAKTLTIIVPCFNEQEVIFETAKELSSIVNGMIKKQQVSDQSRILFVDDGSKDTTWDCIQQLSASNTLATGIKFSRNFGHQNALIAGLTVVQDRTDMAITIDADLQDDVNVIPDMVAEYHKGAQVVYGVRNNRETDTWFKRRTAMAFYGLMKRFGVDMVPNHADYRLLGQVAIKGLLKYRERNLFLRGVVPLVGYPSAKVYYARKERYAGKSKYPLRKMLNFAVDGISSFSIAPIRAIMYLGITIVLMSIVLMAYTLVQHALGHVNAGWSSLMISIWFLGGVQLVSLSIIGEYVGKVFTEVKERPRFEIETDLYTAQLPTMTHASNRHAS